MNEIWKEIDFSSDYLISNLGRVKSLKFGREKILSPCRVGDGYLCVGLSKDSIVKKFYVHHLVLNVFVEKLPFKDAECNHIDGNKENNAYSNLEWVTRSENEKHAHRLGLKEPPCVAGEMNSHAKLTNSDIIKIINLVNTNLTIKEISKALNVSASTVYSIINNKTWKNIPRVSMKVNKQPKGVNRPQSKLSDKDIVEIRKLKIIGLSNVKIASSFNVSKTTIRDIIVRKTWRHI